MLIQRKHWNLPPVWNVSIVVPVLSVFLCVDIRVHPSFAACRRGPRHCCLEGPLWRTYSSHRTLGGLILEGSEATLQNTRL